MWMLRKYICSTKYRLLLLLLLWSVGHAELQAQVPRVIGYQGVLVDKANRPKPTGDYQFTFELFPSPQGGIASWGDVQTLRVTNGSFSTLLGESPAFPASLDFDQQYWLEISVATGGSSLFETLSPRVQLTSVAYAQNIPDNTVTTAKLKDGAVTDQKIEDGAVANPKLGYEAVSEDKLESGSVTNLKLGFNSVSEDKLQDGSVTNPKLAYEAVSEEKIQDRAITEFKIASDAVQWYHIAEGNVGSRELSDAVSFKSVWWTNDQDKSIVYIGSAFSADGQQTPKGGGVFVYDNGGLSDNGSNYATGMFGDGTKKFIMRDPTNAGRLIQYVCLEGPEAAIYTRGRATLRGGKATITLPDYFATIAVDSTVTVSLTPRAATSKGLATLTASARTITVSELFQGSGNYEFDYTIHAVRKGFEDYSVYVYPDATGNFPGPLKAFNSSAVGNDK